MQLWLQTVSVEYLWWKEKRKGMGMGNEKRKRMGNEKRKEMGIGKRKG